MVAVIGNVLTGVEVAALREAAATLAFQDGRATAGRYAKDVKQNEQAKGGAALEAILEKVRNALDGHELFRSIARPRHFTRMLLSRYGPGMEYGAHVDDAIMAGARTDMSFTLYLSEEDSYDGGGLIIQDAVEERRNLDEFGAHGDKTVINQCFVRRVGGRRVGLGWVHVGEE